MRLIKVNLYLILFVISAIIIAILSFFTIRDIHQNFSHFKISDFKKNKESFEKIILLMNEETTNTKNKTRINEIQKLETELSKKCGIHHITSFNVSSNNSSIFVCFILEETERSYKMFLYHPDNELPEKYSSANQSKKISNNWFYISTVSNLRQLVFLFCILAFIVAWCYGIIKFRLYLKRER